MAAAKGNNYAKGNKGGRPKFIIDYDQVKQLAALQCTQDEIASYLGCNTDTLQKDKEFNALYKAGMNKGRMSLRRKQWKALEEGNTTMLIWLGKQYLGQREPRNEDNKDDTPPEQTTVKIIVEDARTTAKGE